MKFSDQNSNHEKFCYRSDTKEDFLFVVDNAEILKIRGTYRALMEIVVMWKQRFRSYHSLA